jgi:SAM-dependent methyltransferase
MRGARLATGRGADIVPRTGGCGMTGATGRGMAIHYELSPCPACGTRDATTLATREEIQEEMEALWTFHTRRLRHGTPLERLADRTVFSQDPPLRLSRCAACGLVYRNPREREQDLRETYASEDAGEETLRALFETQLSSYRAQAGRIADLLPPAATGLEVGSYVGGFLAAARERGWSFEGIDVNPSAVRFARRQGFRVLEGTLEVYEPRPSHDAVVIWNTFEQLADPRGTAASALRLLKPGGVFVVRVPNGAFYAALRRRRRGALGALGRALLAHNNLLGFPYRHGFTPGSLRGMLERVGFREIRRHGDVLVPIADEFTRTWATLEERAIKAVLKRAPPPLPPPWFELYATPADGS